MQKHLGLQNGYSKVKEIILESKHMKRPVTTNCDTKIDQWLLAILNTQYYGYNTEYTLQLASYCSYCFQTLIGLICIQLYTAGCQFHILIHKQGTVKFMISCLSLAAFVVNN